MECGFLILVFPLCVFGSRPVWGLCVKSRFQSHRYIGSLRIMRAESERICSSIISASYGSQQKKHTRFHKPQLWSLLSVGCRSQTPSVKAGHLFCVKLQASLLRLFRELLPSASHPNSGICHREMVRGGIMKVGQNFPSERAVKHQQRLPHAVV